MTTIVVVLVFALACIAAIASLANGQMRRHARERDRLINQICHLAGKPWLPAPASESQPEVEDPDAGRYIYAPDQLPDDYS